MPRDWGVFINSFFFVLGFSLVFSVLGILLQTVLAGASLSVHTWLGRIGGLVIILFGIYLLGLIKIPFLEKEHKIIVKKRFSSQYLTSFVFGAAFAVGWTPCVGAVLGAVLTLAATQPSYAFFMLLAYSLGLGFPFLLIGLFTNEARKFISNAGKWIRYLNYVFAVILILLGILVFTSQLGRIANFEFASSLLLKYNLGYVHLGSTLGIGVAFFGGLLSFLSPCVLPLIPAFLTYLATLVVRK